jgi:hypothetical protein
MIEREIIVTCSNPHVAHAAVASIGGDLARRLELDADRGSVSLGVLASRRVCDFVRRAQVSDWKGLRAAARGADMPILSGLRYILETGQLAH